MLWGNDLISIISKSCEMCHSSNVKKMRLVCIDKNDEIRKEELKQQYLNSKWSACIKNIKSYIDII